MASKSPIYCLLCKETMDPENDLEHHLVYEHKPRELAAWITTEWEARELGESE